MSTGLALAQRQQQRQQPAWEEGEQHPRHIEIVSTRRQRRARPRVLYALVTVAGLFAILIAQLLLSIVVSDGAYQIAGLQSKQTEMSRDRQSLTEQLQVLSSPQNLAANAEVLGMVANTSTTFLRLSDGAVLGAPEAAPASAGSVVGPDGALLIPDELLNGVRLVTPPSGTAVSSGATFSPRTTAPGAPAGSAVVGSVASKPEGLPAPITR